jgi:hypothetical protein
VRLHALVLARSLVSAIACFSSACARSLVSATAYFSSSTQFS